MSLSPKIRALNKKHPLGMAPVSLLTPAQCLGITANRCGEFYIVGWMSPVGGGLTQRWLGREGKEKISHVKAHEKGRIWQCEN